MTDQVRKEITEWFLDQFKKANPLASLEEFTSLKELLEGFTEDLFVGFIYHHCFY